MTAVNRHQGQMKRSAKKCECGDVPDAECEPAAKLHIEGNPSDDVETGVGVQTECTGVIDDAMDSAILVLRFSNMEIKEQLAKYSVKLKECKDKDKINFYTGLFGDDIL